MTLYTHIGSNIRKTWLLFSLFFIIIIGLGWFLGYYFNNQGILFWAAAISILMSFLSYWFSDKIVLAISKARLVKHEESPELYHIVENLCITAGLLLPRIYIIDDPALNAFATGRNQKNAVVVVTSGLLQTLNRSELEGVIAHELSHIGNRDILLQTIVVVLVGAISMVADIFIRGRFLGRKSNDNEGSSQAGAILMIIGIIFLILSPLIAQLIQLAISRKREFLADASGALLTRYPEGLASALEKISQSSALRSANTATAHLYIANPLKGKGISKLFSTHPPIEKRIAILRNMDI